MHKFKGINKYFRVIIIAITITGFFLNPMCTFAFLKTKGKDIVDSTGQKVYLKGMGLGGWLVPEGYMLHCASEANSPTEIHNAIEALIGPAVTDEFFTTYRDNYVSAADIEMLAGWGFNSIRLPFHYQDFSPKDQPGAFIDEGFNRVDSLLSWCKANNLYLILDMHCAPGAQNAGNISDSDGEARLWTDTTNQTRTVEIWKKIAERYADEDWIVGYDLLNEPVLPQGYGAMELRVLYIRITRAIREVDANHIIFIEGNNWATDFASLTPPWDGNMAYSFHKYWSVNDVASIQAYLDIRKTWSYPLWMGESGENSNTWFLDCVNLLENNTIDWAWWAHKKVETTTSPLSAPIPATYQMVLNYWNGSGPKPINEVCQVAFTELAENLKLKNCEFRPDVVASLFHLRADLPVPYKPLIIPGLISCADYDIGTIGHAYYDKDDQRTTWDWNVDQPWNRGSKYRNDGVDIEAAKSADTLIYNVGWIEDGEWLSFTVDALYESTYSAVFRIATPNTNGRMQIHVNGQLQKEVNIPVTGGWQTWQPLTVNDLTIPEGEQVLRLYFAKGGFNLRSMELTADPAGIRYDQLNEFVLVGQNYPNPFNGTTVIPIKLGKDADVSIQIYDLNGKQIRTLFNGRMNVGTRQIPWDGNDENNIRVASGMYIFKVSVEGKSKSKSMLLIK
jgi:endoglucanase